MTATESGLARAVLQQNLRVRPGESVLIESWTHALPYARAFVEETRRLGAYPTVIYEDETAWWRAIGAKRHKTLGAWSAAEKAAVAAADVYVYFWGPEDRPRLARLPDKLQDTVTAYNETWYDVARGAKLRGCRMTVAQATDAAARPFGLNGAAWRRRLVAAGAVDAAGMRRRGLALVRRLEKGSELRVRHTNGTDLTFRLTGIKARVDAGIIDADARKRRYGMIASNPSGQIIAAVDRAAATGTFVGNRAVYIGEDTFDGFRWRFEDGRLVERSGGRGRAAFEAAFAKAPKGRDRMGYFSLGLNPLGRNLPPCEDTEAGAILLGIGGNTFAGGRQRVPFVGYAMLGEGTVELDGRPIARGGRFV